MQKILMRTFLLVGFAALLNLHSALAFAVEVKPDAVLPLGIFSGVKATADHTYGHEVRLWRVGNRMVGQLIYWDANPEGQRGRFDDGTFEPQSGVVTFSVTVTRHDVQPNVHARAAFRGNLARGGLWGELKWEDEAARGRGKGGVEKLNLLLEKSERLKVFPDVGAWTKALPD